MNDQLAQQLEELGGGAGAQSQNSQTSEWSDLTSDGTEGYDFTAPDERFRRLLTNPAGATEEAKGPAMGASRSLSALDGEPLAEQPSADETKPDGGVTKKNRDHDARGEDSPLDVFAKEERVVGSELTTPGLSPRVGAQGEPRKQRQHEPVVEHRSEAERADSQETADRQAVTGLDPDESPHKSAQRSTVPGAELDAWKKIPGFSELPWMVQVQLRVLAKERRQRTTEDVHSLLPNLKESQFFVERGFDDQSMLKILASASYQTVEAGDWVFKAGDPGDRFYLILHGSVSVMKRSLEYLERKRNLREIKKKILEAVRILDGLLERQGGGGE